MFKGKSDHIVLVVNDIKKTRQFYEEVLGILPGTILDLYVTYQFGELHLCFKQVDGIQSSASSIIHIGIDFPSRSDVEDVLSKIKASGYRSQPSAISGGPGEGPYRFYIKDPDGYTLEFESWENCSD